MVVLKSFITYSVLAELIEFTWDLFLDFPIIHNIGSSSKESSIWCVRKIFRKSNTSYLLIRTRTWVRNVAFSEHFANVLNGWSLMILGSCTHDLACLKSRYLYSNLWKYFYCFFIIFNSFINVLSCGIYNNVTTVSYKTLFCCQSFCVSLKFCFEFFTECILFLIFNFFLIPFNLPFPRLAL